MTWVPLVFVGSTPSRHDRAPRSTRGRGPDRRDNARPREPTLITRHRGVGSTPWAAAVLGAALLTGVIVAAGQVGPPGYAHPFTTWGGLLRTEGVWPDRNRWPGLALAGFLAAFAVLWCVVFRRARQEHWSTRTVWWLGAGWMTPVAFGPPVLSNDVFSYVAQGAVARAGEDPTRISAYALGWSSPLLQAVDPRWRESPSPYGPLATLLARTAAAEHPVVSVLLLRSVAVIAIAAAATVLVHLARRVDPTTDRAATSALLLSWASPLLILHVVASVHFEGVLLLLVVAALWCLQHESRFAAPAAVVCAVTAAAVKLPIGGVALLAVVIVAVQRTRPGPARVGTALGLAALAAGVWTAWCLTAGSGWNVLAVVSTPASGRTPVAPATFLADLMTPLRWSGWADGATLDQVGRSTAALAGGAVIVVVLATAARRPLSTTFGLALLALALGSPVLYPWYLAWSVPLLAVAGGSTTARRLAVVSALSAVMTVQGLTRAETIVAVGIVLVAVGTVVVATEPRVRALPTWSMTRSPARRSADSVT